MGEVDDSVLGGPRRVKLGVTVAERNRRNELKISTKIVFAFLPKYCSNTERFVWLEEVIQNRVYGDSLRNYEIITYYLEIE